MAVLDRNCNGLINFRNEIIEDVFKGEKAKVAKLA